MIFLAKRHYERDRYLLLNLPLLSTSSSFSPIFLPSFLPSSFPPPLPSLLSPPPSIHPSIHQMILPSLFLHLFTCHLACVAGVKRGGRGKGRKDARLGTRKRRTNSSPRAFFSRVFLSFHPPFCACHAGHLPLPTEAVPESSTDKLLIARTAWPI